MLDRIAVFLEREGGYHLLSVLMIAVGVAVVDSAQRAMIGRDLVIFGLGVLARSMGSPRKAAAATGGSETTTTTSSIMLPQEPPRG